MMREETARGIGRKTLTPALFYEGPSLVNRFLARSLRGPILLSERRPRGRGVSPCGWSEGPWRLPHLSPGLGAQEGVELTATDAGRSGPVAVAVTAVAVTAVAVTAVAVTAVAVTAVAVTPSP